VPVLNNMLYFRFISTLITTFAILQGARTPVPAPPSTAPKVPEFLANIVRTPLWFEPNVGQTKAGVPFLSRAQNQTVFLSGAEALISLADAAGSDSVRMRFTGAAAAARAEGIDPLPSVSNYFLGKDSKKWHTNVPHFGKVRFRDVYPGIDVVYYSNGGVLEYDFVVSAGADPRRIQLSYHGAGTIRIDDSGNVRLALRGREIVQQRPRVYQDINGRRVEIAGTYRITAKNQVRFALAEYNRAHALVIDPVLDYSVYLGGKAYDTAIAIALDAQGNKYVTGTTASPDLLLGTATSQNQFAGATDAYLAKFSAAGNLTSFSYFGGASSVVATEGKGNTTGRSIFVDTNRNVYIGGDTNSPDLPVPANHDPTNRFAGGSADVFVIKVAAAGDQILYSRYIGGGSDDFIGGGPDGFIPGRADEFGNGLTVDPQGNAYITGFTKSSDYPTTANAYMQRTKGGGESAFVTKINPAGDALAYSTILEGKSPSSKDGGEGIAIDSTGNIYVTGYTTSTDFPVLSAFQTTKAGAAGFEDAFVVKLDPTAGRPVYSTYLGGTGRDLGFRIAVDASGSAYITGYTQSGDFPTRNAAQPSYGGGGADAFVTKLSPNGTTLAYSTYLGGSGDDWGFADIAVDNNGNAYVAGYTTSPDLKITNAFQPAFTDANTHGFVAELNANGTAWAFLSYYGGSQHDEIHGLAYDAVRNTISIAGFTSSPNLPGAKNAYVGDAVQKYDAFIAQISGLGTLAPTLVVTQLQPFTINAGGTPISQTITLSSSTNTALQFTASNANPANTWLTVSPASGTTPATLTVTVDPKTLGGGSTSGAININVVGGSPISVPVIVGLNAGPVVTSVSPNPIAVGSQNTIITVSGSGFTSGSTVTLNNSAAVTQFVSANSLTAVVPSGLLASAGTVSVAVNNGGAGSAPVLLTVATGVPIISPANVLNGATNLPGAISPGEIITIKGTGFGPATLAQAQVDPATGGISTTLASTRVLINGVAAPLVYAVQNQVSAIVPYSVTTGPATIQVEYQGQQSASTSVDVALAVPGIFTVDSSGRGQGVVFNEDGTLNSANNPARRGSVITFYGTGEGLTTPAGATGSLAPNPAPKPVLPLAVKINGLDTEVTYFGGAPTLVEGLLQVNARIPEGAPSGTAIPLVLQVGGISSPFTVTLAVQ
jgi:uncharacterized protein (TIGR03437 family)